LRVFLTPLVFSSLLKLALLAFCHEFWRGKTTRRMMDLPSSKTCSRNFNKNRNESTLGAQFVFKLMFQIVLPRNNLNTLDYIKCESLGWTDVSNV